MIKLIPTENIYGTSWFGHKVVATPLELIEKFGEPHYIDENVDEKVSLEWDFETEDGVVFTIYDWKEYDAPAARHYTGKYHFHIGMADSMDSLVISEIFKERGLELI